MLEIKVSKYQKDRQCNGQKNVVLSVLLRFTDSDCAFGIFKLFFYKTKDRATRTPLKTEG